MTTKQTRFLFLWLCFIAAQASAQNKKNTFYLGISPLSVLQGNIRIDPGYTRYNARFSLPIHVYCLPEISSKWTNPYSNAKQVGSALAEKEEGDLLKGYGVDFRAQFMVSASLDKKSKPHNFIGFSLGYHAFQVETRGLSYQEQITFDGKPFYDFGQSAYELEARMIPLRLEFGREHTILEKYRFSYSGGLSYHIFLKSEASEFRTSKSDYFTSIFYTKTPGLFCQIQFGRVF